MIMLSSNSCYTFVLLFWSRLLLLPFELGCYAEKKRHSLGGVVCIIVIVLTILWLNRVYSYSQTSTFMT